MRLADPSPSPTPDAAPRRPSVVLADPHGVYRAGIARTLRRDGYDVTTLEDGAAAVLAARDLGPDLLLVADGLPSLGGVEVVRTLADDPRAQDTCLIVLTADPGLELDRRAQDAGADAVIDKASSRREIAARIAEELVRSREERDDAARPDVPPRHAAGRLRRLRPARPSA